MKQYKEGDMFIIEIGSTYTGGGCLAIDGDSDDPIMLYKAKGFNSLVFDDNGLDKLEPYNKNLKYNDGDLQVAYASGKEYAFSLFKALYCDDTFRNYREFIGTSSLKTLMRACSTFADLKRRLDIAEEQLQKKPKEKNLTNKQIKAIQNTLSELNISVDQLRKVIDVL